MERARRPNLKPCPAPARLFRLLLLLPASPLPCSPLCTASTDTVTFDSSACQPIIVVTSKRTSSPQPPSSAARWSALCQPRACPAALALIFTLTCAWCCCVLCASSVRPEPVFRARHPPAPRRAERGSGRHPSGQHAGTPRGKNSAERQPACKAQLASPTAHALTTRHSLTSHSSARPPLLHLAPPPPLALSSTPCSLAPTTST